MKVNFIVNGEPTQIEVDVAKNLQIGVIDALIKAEFTQWPYTYYYASKDGVRLQLDKSILKQKDLLKKQALTISENDEIVIALKIGEGA